MDESQFWRYGNLIKCMTNVKLIIVPKLSDITPDVHINIPQK